jgi:hypothetical protein
MLCIIFSHNRPCQLHALLESMQRFAQSIVPVVLWHATSDAGERGYQQASKYFSARWVHEGAFRVDLFDIITQGAAGCGVIDPYIMLLHDDQVFRRRFLVGDAQRALRDPEVLGVSLTLAPHILGNSDGEACDLPEFENRIFADDRYKILSWPWDQSSGPWGHPFTTEGAVYRTKQLLLPMYSYNWTTRKEFECAVDGDTTHWRNWGKRACYWDAPAMTAKTTVGSGDLSDVYEGGMKIDITPLVTIQPCSIPILVEHRFRPIASEVIAAE